MVCEGGESFLAYVSNQVNYVCVNVGGALSQVVYFGAYWFVKVRCMYSSVVVTFCRYFAKCFAKDCCNYWDNIGERFYLCIMSIVVVIVRTELDG